MTTAAEAALAVERAYKWLSADAATRKNTPMVRGLLDYFPLACAAVADLSRIGNEQHNPGEPMRWAREKSTDHADCIVRHLVDRGTVDTDGVRHSAKVAWRALAMLQLEIEAASVQEAPAQTEDARGCTGCTCKPAADGCYYDCHGADDCTAAVQAVTFLEDNGMLSCFCRYHSRWHRGTCPDCCSEAKPA